MLSEPASVWRGLTATRSRDDIELWLRRYWRHCLIVLVGLAFSCRFKYTLIHHESQDYTNFLRHWVEHIHHYGLGKVYAFGFNNYTPFYTYMLGIAVTLFPDVYPLYTIKFLTFFWELFAAYWAWRITWLYYAERNSGSLMPITSAMLILSTPSVITNGAATGQCDIMLAGFILASLCMLIERKPKRAMVFAGLAFAFKPQAIFLSPFLLILMLRGEVKWRHFFIVPAMYLVMCMPSWLEGRPLMKMIFIYISQARGHYMSYNAGNFWLYNSVREGTEPYVRLGSLFAFSLALFFVIKFYRSWKTPLTPESCLTVALFFASLMPFTLPLMHDRYFFMADIISLVLACMRPRLFFITALFQSASLMALPRSQLPKLQGFFGWVQSFGLRNAIYVNLLAIICLYVLGRAYIWNGKEARA